MSLSYRGKLMMKCVISEKKITFVKDRKFDLKNPHYRINWAKKLLLKYYIQHVWDLMDIEFSGI